jgi:hypothetical protein
MLLRFCEVEKWPRVVRGVGVVVYSPNRVEIAVSIKNFLPSVSVIVFNLS